MTQLFKNIRIANKPKIIDWSQPVGDGGKARADAAPDPEELALAARREALRLEIAELERVRDEAGLAAGLLKSEAEATVRAAEANAAGLKAEAEKLRVSTVEYRAAEEERLLREAKVLREDASATGFKEGREEGRQVAADKAAGVLKNLEAVLAQAIREKDAAILASEKQVLDLALAIARKVVRAEVTVNPEVIELTLKQALAKVVDRDSITIYVNLSDLEKVTKRKGEILKQLDPGSRVTVIEDENIEPGGLVIQTNLGNIDATISGQELEIDKILYAAYDQENPAEV